MAMKILSVVLIYLKLFAFSLALKFVIQPLVLKLLRMTVNQETNSPSTNNTESEIYGQKDVLLILVLGTFCCACITELIGLHCIFGAFLFGITFPVKLYSDCTYLPLTSSHYFLF